jgi:hypothetical protein
MNSSLGHQKNQHCLAIYSTGDAFAAIKADGSITVWGDSVGTMD